MRGPLRIAASAGFAAISGSITLAGEFCVTCTSPAATYKCTFPGSGDAAGLQLTCIGELAREGGHASCEIARNRQGPCEGKVHEIAASDIAPEAVPAVKQEQAAPAEETYEPDRDTSKSSPPPADHAADEGLPDGAAPVAKKEKKDRGPRTVEEMVKKGATDAGKAIEGAGEAAGNATKAAGTAVEKTGSAIGNAAKKTWKCITSLFGDC